MSLDFNCVILKLWLSSMNLESERESELKTSFFFWELTTDMFTESSELLSEVSCFFKGFSI